MKSNDGFCEKCGTLIAPHKCPKFVPVSKRPMGSENKCATCGGRDGFGHICRNTITIPVAEYEGLRKLRDFLPILLDAMEFAEAQFKDTLSDPMDALEGQDALDRYNNVALALAAIKEQEG